MLNDGETVAHVTNDNHRFDVRSDDFTLRFQVAVGPSPDGKFDYSLLIRNIMAETRGDEDEKLQLFYEDTEHASIGGSDTHEAGGNTGHTFTVKHNDDPIVTLTVHGPERNRDEL